MKYLKKKFFGKNLDFRVKLFNIMALGGITISLFTVVQSILGNRWNVTIVSCIMMILSYALLDYAARTGKYNICYNITIVVIFFIFFPLLFFEAGGYRSGVPSIFIFAILFTVLMKDGAQALYISIAELVVYASICWIAYIRPDSVVQYSSEKEILMDIIFSYCFVGLICGIVLSLHIQEYTYQRTLLEEQNKKLKYYDEVKSTFLTTVAHEIKNPLNIIGLYAQDTHELAQETPVDVTLIKENQKIIEDTVIRLDRIVVDLMDTVSIEQGRLNLSMAPMDMAILVREAVKLFKENESRDTLQNNTLVLDIQENTAPIIADYARLFQVMMNLLSNSIRHTKNGTITVTLKKVAEGQFVSVRDTGEGMKKEIRENAFKGYVSTSKDYWRHGIGLYICHQIVEAHDGKIWIESEEGKGTEISFIIPLHEV